MFRFPVADHYWYHRELFPSNIALYVHMRAYLIERQKVNSLGNITWSEMGK